MSKQDIVICGLRYGKTKYQAEQIKKYIEENSLTEIKITIFDSESKQMLEKYKNAWEDMSKWFSQRNSKYDTPKSLEIENFVSTFMQELEQKHGIEVE